MGQSGGGKVGVQRELWSRERADPRLEWNYGRWGEGSVATLGSATWEGPGPESVPC